MQGPDRSVAKSMVLPAQTDERRDIRVKCVLELREESRTRAPVFGELEKPVFHGLRFPRISLRPLEGKS